MWGPERCGFLSLALFNYLYQSLPKRAFGLGNVPKVLCFSLSFSFLRLSPHSSHSFFFLEGGFFVFSRATPVAYGGSQARGLKGAVAAGLRHSHSNAGSMT